MPSREEWEHERADLPSSDDGYRPNMLLLVNISSYLLLVVNISSYLLVAVNISSYLLFLKKFLSFRAHEASRLDVFHVRFSSKRIFVIERLGSVQ